MGRDKGKGRGSSGRGSGRKLFIANEDELQLRDREVHEAREARIKRRADDGDAVENANEEEDDDEDDEEEQPQKVESVFGFQRMSRAEAAAAKKSTQNPGDDDEDEEEDQPKGLLSGMATKVNPNRQPKPVEKMIKIKDLNTTDVVTDPEAGMNRKEREAAAAIRAKEEWQRKHMAGETEQARLDLERLAIVRKRREEAAKKRESEGRAPGWTASGVQSDESSDSDDSSEDNKNKKGTKSNTKVTATSNIAATSSSITTTTSTSKGKVESLASKQLAAIQAEEKELSLSIAAKKKAIALGTNDDDNETAPSDGGPPKLKSMDIKKMNGDQLKEHLKARKLDVQGQKKDLMKRLSDYEASRP